MNPYSLDLNQHPSNFDVLSLQSKQLPHRQQAHKPVLKYHASIIKPVKLFKQSDSYRLNLEKQLLGMQGISPVPGVPTPCLVMKPTLSAPQSGAGGRPGLSSALQADNSYQQPFSAKKVNHGVLYQQPDQKGVGNVTSALQNSVSEYVTTSVGSGSTLQYNSFMRPLSSKHSNSIVKTKNSQISGDSGKLSGRSTHKLKTVQKPLDRQGFTEQKQNKNHSDQLKTLQQRNQSSSNSQDSGIAVGKKNLKYERDVRQRNSPISPASFVQNPNYTPNSELGSENSLRNRNISTVSQQSLKSNDVKTPTFSKTKHNQGPAQRGVNYAPGDASSNPHSIEQNIKPYVHDIKFSLSAVARGDAEMESFLLPAGAGEIQGLLERNYAFNEKVHTLLEVSATSLLSVKKGASFKLPDTDKLNHILYYKENLNENNRAKNHTAVSVLGEQRPRADGALTPDAQDMTEQKDVDNTSEEEASSEFEDVGSTPSGERLPGDGEAYCEDLNDEDDGINDLYEDNDEESDKCTVSSRISQISSSSSLTRPSTLQSTSTQTPVNGKEKTKLITRPYSSGEHVVHPSLRYSLFPAIPPTINFVAEGEKVERLPWEMRKLLKWRMSPITPNVVKSTLARSNFRITKKNNDWLGCFGKHMKAAGFKAIREYQKLNHFPGSFQLGRKDRLWRNLSRMQLSFGKKDFGFFPQSYVLPQDMKLLKRAWEDGGSRQKWIIKPPASARGIGIKVIHKWNQIPRRRPVLVQKYLSKPLLINDSKFDMRVYVYVTSYDPLRAYVFEDGLARFASSKYSSSLKSLGNKFMHLTNYSVNKYNSEYQSNTDDTVCQGHKWSLKSLWSYLQEHGVNTATIWDNIKDIVVKTLISAETNINSMIKANTRSRYVAHELFGFDILLDQKMQPWVLEVNISPSLHSNSPLDITIKGQMIRDLLNLAGFRIPDKNDVAHSAHPNSSAIDMSAHLPPNDYCMDKRLFTSQLSADERAKHAFFCNRHQDQQALQTILDTLTPDDIRILTESIDEDSRKGGFIRVFPTPNTHKYLRYLEQPRYYNLLLDQWVQRYNHLEQRGISLLQSFCEDGIHLENPTENYRHQWSPPNSSVIISTRDTKQSQTSPTKGKEQFGVSLTRGKDSPLVKSSHSVAQLPRVPGLPSKVPKESSLSLCASISAPSTLNR